MNEDIILWVLLATVVLTFAVLEATAPIELPILENMTDIEAAANGSLPCRVPEGCIENITELFDDSKN